MSTSRFLAGAMVGLVAGLMLAPDKGENTRQNLAETADKWRDKLNRLVGKASVHMADLRDFLEQDIEGLSEDVRNRIKTILDESEEMSYSANSTHPISNGTA